VIGQFLATYDLRLYCRTGVSRSTLKAIRNFWPIRDSRAKTFDYSGFLGRWLL